MSLRLTTSLSQRLVLTPQLRQRIEMLQMTTLELTDLIQQQLLENPVLEEVATQEEAQELAEKILDHLASSDSETPFEQSPGEAADLEAGSPASMVQVTRTFYLRCLLPVISRVVKLSRGQKAPRRLLGTK